MSQAIGMSWKKSCAFFSQVFRWLLLRLIDGYAVSLGPHLGGRCRFHPSCSVYAREAIIAHGPFRGGFLALRRLIKCGPWHKGGLDPVP
jgi:putative membrane protein insertion efficiency factor